MSRYRSYIIAAAAALPGVFLWLTGAHHGEGAIAPALAALLFGIAILGAAFLLSWAAEAAQMDISAGAALAGLALITVLPEYAVDMVYTFKAGDANKFCSSLPEAQQAVEAVCQNVHYAAANMTGGNRLLVGLAWPLIVIVFWFKTRKQVINLSWENTAEVAFLGVATLYSFTIPLKESISLVDMVFLIGLFVAYLWRLSKLPREEELVEGPAAVLAELPKVQRRTGVAILAVVAALVILVVAEPFAESLVEAGRQLNVNEFLLIQWLAPLASESPEVVVAILFTLHLKPTAALGAMISSKINQWTLLVGMIPLVFNIGNTLNTGGWNWLALPLGARQNEEFFLTAAQSLFALALLLRLKFHLQTALLLLGLFVAQFVTGFILQNDEAASIQALTIFAWVYIALAGVLIARSFRFLDDYIQVGLLNRPAPELEAAMEGTTSDEDLVGLHYTEKEQRVAAHKTGEGANRRRP